MSSFLSATAPERRKVALRLSRQGVAVASAVVAAFLFGVVASLYISSLQNDSDTLQAAIRDMQHQMDQQRSNDPNVRKVTELTEQLATIQRQTQQLADISTNVVSAAEQMPEFKSPQYREPFQDLLKQIHDLDLIAQSLRPEPRP